VQRDAQNNLNIARARLRALLGQMCGDPAFDVRGDLSGELAGEPLPADKAFELAVEHRPDIKSLEWHVSQAQADVKVEDTRAFPDFKPLLWYTRQFQEGPIGQPDASSWNAAITTSLPLFNRNQGNRCKARSKLVQNQYDLQTGLVNLRAEIEQVVTEFQTAYENARAVAGEQLRLARQVRESITQAYEAGGRPLIDFLDAQRNYRETYRL
jgi:cobalt-zinc-cadmium efflux system outer membrane protein